MLLITVKSIEGIHYATYNIKIYIKHRRNTLCYLLILNMILIRMIRILVDVISYD